MRPEETANHGASTRGAGHRSTTRWLIVRDGGGGPEPLCVDDGDTRLLGVFSFREEAEMFLCLGGHGSNGWRARECGAEGLVSMLDEPSCTDVKGVALDPVPGMTENGTVGLVALSRKRFLESVPVKS